MEVKDKRYIDTKVTNYEKVNEEFTKVKISVCSYSQIANGTKFTKDGITRALPTLNYAPVIGYWRDGEEDFSGHGQELVLSDDGGMEMKVYTVPYGVVIKDTATWELRNKPNGESEEYLCIEAYLWNRYEKQIKKVKENKCNQSMEVNIAGGEYKDNYFEIQDFSFSALCILSENVAPAFRLADVRTASNNFSKSDFHKEYSEMLDKLNTFLYEEEETGGEEEMTVEEVSKEAIETAENFEETPVVEDSIQDSTQEEVVEEEQKKEFTEESSEVEESTEEVSENPQEEDFACGSSPKRKDDEDKKKKMSESEEENFEDKYNSLNTEYSKLQEKYNALESEITELRAYKEHNEKVIRLAKEEEIFSQFEEIKDNEELKSLKEKSADYSLDELEMRCYAILGKVKKTTTKVEDKPNNSAVFNRVDTDYQEEKPHGKYDHLIEKYGKKRK